MAARSAARERGSREEPVDARLSCLVFDRNEIENAFQNQFSEAGRRPRPGAGCRPGVVDGARADPRAARRRRARAIEPGACCADDGAARAPTRRPAREHARRCRRPARSWNCRPSATCRRRPCRARRRSRTRSGGAPAINGTAVGGYGELTLNAPSNAPAVVDLRRFVLFVGHNFTDRIRFYSEVEVEHAVSSAEDAGEVEIEQAYVDGLLSRRLNLRAGLILMPVGIINIYHEPPTFNGVDRPEVDTLIIPSTWREPGFGIFGELTTGVAYQLYLINGLNANGFTAETAVADGHQEGMLAAARDFGAVGRLTYEPMLATILGVSGYFATSGNSLRATVGNVPVGLWEIDARTRYRGFTARAEFAMLFIGETAALNQALAANDPTVSLPVAKRSQGGYLEAGYDMMRLLLPDDRSERDAVQPLRLRQHAGQRRRRADARRGVPPLRLHGRSRVPPDPADRAQGRLPPALVRRRLQLQRARRRARLDVLMPRTKVFAPLLPVLVLAAAPACNPPSPPPPDDPAEVVVGERLFLETRFAQFFAANGGSDVNQPLASGDPVLDVLETTADARTNPFAGKSMNCRVCHLVDESPDPGTTGTRTYADFARRSPIPDRGDGRTHTPRNSPPLVNASLARDENFFLHYDGEFPSAEDLVVGTFTGRNFGWLPDERAQAVAHIARVIRADDGSNEFASPCYGLSYTTILAGTSPAIPEICRLPEALRLDVNAVSDEPLVRGAAAVVAAYMRALVYQQDGAGQYIGSPFDRFLILNGLPRQPEAGETGVDYARRLRAALAALPAPKLLDNPAVLAFEHHDQDFAFGADELAGLRIFLAEPAAAAPTADELAAGGIGNCIACHAPPHFTDFGFHNNGVAQVDYDGVHGAGAFAALAIPGLAERQAAPATFLPPSGLYPTGAGPFLAQPSAANPGLTDLGVWNVLANDAVPGAQATLAAHPGPRDRRHRHGAAAAPRDRALQDRGPARPRPVGAVLPHRGRG